jgi:formate dehydrogenase beta subunit
MKETVFARWGKAVWDGRGGRIQGDESPKITLPFTDAFPENTGILLCGKGFLQFDEALSFASALREYVRQIQAEYCCGKCLAGLKGTKMLQALLDKIAQGRGEEADLAMLERVANVLDDSAKCSVCQSAGELVKDGLSHFREDFRKALNEGLPADNMRYLARISAPCMTTCPCHINIPAYVEMLQEARYDESLRIIREEMPLPGITGRVCPAPCQKACTLANMGTASIPIKVLKRVAADYEMEHKLSPPIEKMDLTGQPVAVVGAGPAGLAAAYYLNRLGHPVTIFEALPVSGGMVGVGIPPYRQPRDVLKRDISIVLDLGVKLEDGVTLGRDVSIQDLLDRGFKAVFLGVGAHRSIRLGVKGEDEGINGVFSGGIDFLRELNLDEPVAIGDKVVVVGGGNTAVDCARTCLRMGAVEVHVVYRRTEKEMPSDPHEVRDAIEEGVLFHFLTQPVEILSAEGRLTGLRCLRMELGEPDRSGRRRPVPVEGSEFDVEADTIIPAIGQKSNLDFILPQDGIELTRWGTIKIDPRTMATTREAVFAAGDVVSGPLTVVHGVAGGKRAALGIHNYLTGRTAAGPDEALLEDILAAVEKDATVRVTPRAESREPSSLPQRKLDMRERLTSFLEVESSLSQASSHVESSRCLRCYHLVLVGLSN